MVPSATPAARAISATVALWNPRSAKTLIAASRMRARLSFCRVSRACIGGRSPLPRGPGSERGPDVNEGSFIRAWTAPRQGLCDGNTANCDAATKSVVVTARDDDGDPQTTEQRAQAGPETRHRGLCARG